MDGWGKGGVVGVGVNLFFGFLLFALILLLSPFLLFTDGLGWVMLCCVGWVGFDVGKGRRG
jgi:hypothetical protein